MNIFKRLMGHPIIAIWVLGAIAILLSLNPANKGKHETEGGATTSHEVASEQTSKKLEHIKEPRTLDANANNNSTATSASEAKLATTKVAVSDATADNNHNNKVLAPAVENLKDATVASVKLPSKNLAEKSKDIVQTTKDTQVPANSLNKEGSQGVSNPELLNDSGDLTQTDSTAEILLMAREAYWNNGFDEAVELYLQLIKLNPTKLEYKGELGNVYWKQGYPKKAAELYSEIALPMIENGDSDKVANMVGFIGLFYPDRAATIHQKIISQKSSN